MNAETSPEDRVIDAIAAAANRAFSPDVAVSDDEIEELLRSSAELPADDRAALDALGPEFVRELIRRASVSATPGRKHRASLDPAIERAYVAMNRRNQTDDLSDKARSELDRKRRELLRGAPGDKAGDGQE